MKKTLNLIWSKLELLLDNIFLQIMCWFGSKLFKIVDIYAPNNKVMGITFSNDKDFIDYVFKYEKKKYD